MNLQFIKKRYRKNSLTNPINLYIEIGDSTCEGEGTVPSPMTGNYGGPISDALIFYKVDRTSTDNGSWQAFQQGVNNQPGTGTNAGYSSINSVASNLASLSYTTVGFFKMGKGGSTLVPQVGTDVSWNSVSGTLWTKYRDNFVTVGLAKLKTSGYNATIKGANIRLGTNDCQTPYYDLPSWKSQIQILVANIRTLAKDPNLPIFWVRVRSDLGDVAPAARPPENVIATNQALVDCTVQGNPEYIPNFFVVSVDGPPSDLSDFTHFTPAAKDAQGVVQANYLYALGE
jgi:hypothetical protein